MDQVKKRKVKKVLGWITIVAVVALLAVVPMLTESEVEAEGPQASILSGVVETNSIETVLRGGGILTEEAGVEITVPGGVKLTQFLVSNGDTVAARDAVALVDSISVMNAIVQVQEKLDDLAQQIENASDAETTTEVVARAGGLVKLVYAREGDDVQRVMLEYGALAVLSLDGRMAVEFHTDTVVYVGDAVTVTLADGTAVEGRVESSLDGTVVVSLEDDDYAVGEAVTVADADGRALGSGQLQIHNAWNAVAWSGTVAEVSVEAGQTVDAGDVLFELEDTDGGADYEELLQERRDYEALMQTLFRLYEDNTVTASCDGIVSGVDEDSEYLLENSDDAEADPLEEWAVLHIIPLDTMTVTITIDERDIGKISLGQIARIQVNALKDQVFDAVVTDIGTHGTNNGGSSKFTVELTLDHDVDMLAGMHASASITLDTTADVATVPVAALCELGSKTVVYTSYDPETGTLTDPVSVTTGVSDGITVEILTGLKTGDTFYYLYFEELEDV